MAVTQRELSYQRRGSIGEEHSFSEVWHVTVTSATDDEFTILGRFSDWKHGQEHDKRKGFYLRDMEFDRGADDIYIWTVTIDWTDDWPSEPDPRKRPPRYTLGSISIGYSELFDSEGKPYQNTAGDFFSDLPEKKLAAWRLTIEKNIPVPWPDWILEYNSAVNDAAVKLGGVRWPKETLLITDLSIGDTETENVFTYAPMSMVVEYNPRTWVQRIPNRGLYERYIATDGGFNPDNIEWKKRRILNASGEQVDEPVWLDKNGSAIRESKTGDANTGAFIYRGEIKSQLTKEELIFIDRWDNPRKPFSKLPILK